jgi:hypothetical protein
MRRNPNLESAVLVIVSPWLDSPYGKGLKKIQQAGKTIFHFSEIFSGFPKQRIDEEIATREMLRLACIATLRAFPL